MCWQTNCSGIHGLYLCCTLTNMTWELNSSASCNTSGNAWENYSIPPKREATLLKDLGFSDFCSQGDNSLLAPSELSKIANLPVDLSTVSNLLRYEYAMQYWKHKPLTEQTTNGLIICFCYKNWKYGKSFFSPNILLHLTADKNQFCSSWQKQRK